MTKKNYYRYYIIYFYLITPVIFYSLPILATNNAESISLHFFKSHTVDRSYFILFTIYYWFIGLLVYWLLSELKFKYTNKLKSNILIDTFIILSLLVLFFIQNSYLKLLSNSIIYLLLGNYRITYKVYFTIFIIAIIQVIFFYDRYPVIFFFLLLLMPYIGNLRIKNYLFISFFGIVILVFVLEPLRSGMLPFANLKNLDILLGFYYHVNPIYIGSYMSYTSNFSNLQLLSEIIPFGKTILGTQNVIDSIAAEALPKEIYNDGARLGSNSSMYFRTNGLIILTTSIIFVKIILKYSNLKFFKNSVLLYFILQAPYFIRRSLGTFLLELIILFFFSMFISYLHQWKNK